MISTWWLKELMYASPFAGILYFLTDKYTGKTKTNNALDGLANCPNRYNGIVVEAEGMTRGCVFKSTSQATKNVTSLWAPSWLVSAEKVTILILSLCIFLGTGLLKWESRTIFCLRWIHFQCWHSWHCDSVFRNYSNETALSTFILLKTLFHVKYLTDMSEDKNNDKTYMGKKIETL